MSTRTIFERLGDPFPPEYITWKPGNTNKEKTSCLALAYGDLRAYQNRLDEVVGPQNWEVRYLPWGDDRLVAELTIHTDDGRAITKSSVGESDKNSDSNEIGGTVAEAQAFKRACAQWNLGRYLYTLPSKWVPYDAQKKQITSAGKQELTQIVEAHYRQATIQREIGYLSEGAQRFVLHMRSKDSGKEATPQQVGLLEGRLATILESTERRDQFLGVVTGKAYVKGDKITSSLAQELITVLDPAHASYARSREIVAEVGG